MGGSVAVYEMVVEAFAVRCEHFVPDGGLV